MSYGPTSLDRSRLATELLDRKDEVVDAGTGGAVAPLAAVSDAVDLAVEADRAALGDAGLGER